MPYIYLNNAMVLARYFDKRENMKQQPGAYWHPGYPLLYFGYNLLERMFPPVYRILYGAWSVAASKEHLRGALAAGGSAFVRRCAATDSAAGRM